MDHQVGRILATLNARGHTNNLVVYSSDHGDYMGQHGLILKGKAQLYDSLVRVPLVIAGLHGQRRGETDPALAQLTDIVPTLLEAAGAVIPSPVEDRSLVPQLQRRGEPLRPVAFCQFGGLRAARGFRYKLVETAQDEFVALYDLHEDPGEYENRYLNAQYRSTREELSAALAAQFSKNSTS